MHGKTRNIMSAVRTSPGNSAGHPAPQRLPASGPGAGDTRALGLLEDDDLPTHLADAIDDRIAETLDELLAERIAVRPHRPVLRALVMLVCAGTLAAGALLRHSTLATWTTGAVTAAMCLAMAWRAW
jgi:hypothetical protein